MGRREVRVIVIRTSQHACQYMILLRCTTGLGSFLFVQVARYHIIGLTRRILLERACFVNVSRE